MKERDYSFLEGKEVIYTDGLSGKETPAKVVGCDFDVGITLINANDSTDYLGCIHGPSDPKWRICGGMSQKDLKEYTALFFCVVRQLKAGRVSPKLPLRIEGTSLLHQALDGLRPSAEICPFNQ